MLNQILMKTESRYIPAIGGIFKTLFALLIVAACSDEPEVLPVKPESQSAPEPTEDISNARSRQGPNYNLNVLLLPTKHCPAIGFIKFRQYQDGAQFINLDTWIHGLEPNTNYLLQRAVDTVLDGNCTSTSWLTLGKGLDYQPITTNNRGFGSAELYRSVSSVPVGTTFDIHFQIIKESSMEVVLTGDCYQYTVR